MTQLELSPNFDEDLQKGRICSHCGRFNKIYRRGITATDVRFLATIYKLSSPVQGMSERWVHCSDIKAGTRKGSDSLGLLAKFGLAKIKPNLDEPHKKHTGYWRLTPLGYAFLFANETIPKKVFLYNGNVIGNTEQRVTVNDCLKKTFNYQELMQENA